MYDSSNFMLQFQTWKVCVAYLAIGCVLLAYPKSIVNLLKTILAFIIAPFAVLFLLGCFLVHGPAVIAEVFRNHNQPNGYNTRNT